VILAGKLDSIELLNDFTLISSSQVEDSLKNVSEFDVNTLFGCVSQCLQLITGDKELPTRLPPNISTRFKVCGELAQLCQVISSTFKRMFCFFERDFPFRSRMVTKVTLVIKRF